MEVLRGAPPPSSNRDLKHDDAFSMTWPPVLLIDKCCQVTSLSIERTDHHVLLKASSCLRCLIFEGRNRPQQIIYHWKRNLMTSRIHFKYWKNILISRFYEQFSRNDSAKAPQWILKKSQTYIYFFFLLALKRISRNLFMLIFPRNLNISRNN